jgi:hypothetical protein
MKYHNKKIVRDGEVFDSIKEYKRWCELSLLERAGEITNLRRQVKFVLIPAQYEPDTVGKRGGIKKGKQIERECSYIADFVYEYHKLNRPDMPREVYSARVYTAVEDTKGYKTKDYIIKRKLMLFVHGIRIKEV